MVGKLVRSNAGEWLVEYVEKQYPNYRYYFPVDLEQQVIEENVKEWNNTVLFSTRYFNHELYAIIHDCH